MLTKTKRYDILKMLKINNAYKIFLGISEKAVRVAQVLHYEVFLKTAPNYIQRYFIAYMLKTLDVFCMCAVFVFKR